MNRKITGLVLSVMVLTGFATARTPKFQRLTAEQAKDHIGETATVCGKVVSARYVEQASGKPTFLNLDQPYPNQIFTIVIWGTDRSRFQTPEAYYRDKRVCVTGKIENYNKVPQIVARSPKQIATAAPPPKTK